MAQYILKSALVAEIERLENKNCKNSNDFNLGAATYLGMLKQFIDTLEVKYLQEEPVSEDLEDVSKRYALRQVMASTDTQLTEQAYLSLRLFNGYDLAVAHKDGANWQKNKMMEDAVDGVVAASAGVLIATGFVKSEDVNVKFGDKIKIIVVKED